MLLNWDGITRRSEYIGIRYLEISWEMAIIRTLQFDRCCWATKLLEKDNEKLGVPNYKLKVKCEPEEIFNSMAESFLLQPVG